MENESADTFYRGKSGLGQPVFPMNGELIGSERSERDTIRGNKWKWEIYLCIYMSKIDYS